MRRGLLVFIALVAIKALGAQTTVFVDVTRLATMHPAWQWAQRIEREMPATTLPRLPSFLVTLTEVGLPFALPPSLTEELLPQPSWWRAEMDSLVPPRILEGVWQVQVALPPLPSLDPLARWQFLLQQWEQQEAERVRLRLRLAFADLLPPHERRKVEQRWKELEAQLEPPPVTPSLILLPLSPPPPLQVKPPEPLTDAATILALVSPIPVPLSGTKVVRGQREEETKSERSRVSKGEMVSALKNLAYQAARSFASAYARRQGWRIVTKPQPTIPDGTDQVAKAWRNWLQRIFPKE